MRLLCVTPNPAIDRTVVVRGFLPGAVYRPDGVLDLAGGKGVNVARAARLLGAEVVVTGPLGGSSGEWVRKLARDEGFESHWTAVAGETRSCLSVVDPVAGLATDVNLPGPELSSDEWNRTVQTVESLAVRDTIVTISGSLPRGVGDTEIEALVGCAGRRGLVAVDLAGSALAAACRAGPTWAKGNAEEVSQALGCAIRSAAEAAEAALALVELGAKNALVSLGADGMVVASSQYADGSTPVILVAALDDLPATDGKFRSTVGCGDVLLAALLCGLHGAPDHGLDTERAAAEPHERLVAAAQRAVATATANLFKPGAGLFDLRLAEQLRSHVRVQRL